MHVIVLEVCKSESALNHSQYNVHIKLIKIPLIMPHYIALRRHNLLLLNSTHIPLILFMAQRCYRISITYDNCYSD